MEEETGFRAERMDHLVTLDPLPGSEAARLHLSASTGLAPHTISRREVSEVGMTEAWMPLKEAAQAVRAGSLPGRCWKRALCRPL
ncbi:hypothetical protein [Streptomyces sp. NBRC 110465]|uniref:hypothetical protein n=1 Tax=Streptomyces sp. NBRC 110465 TaxID=1897621 RepID=UPI00358F4BE6